MTESRWQSNYKEGYRKLWFHVIIILVYIVNIGLGLVTFCLGVPREIYAHHKLQSSRRVGSSTDEFDLTDGWHNVLLRLVGAQLERHWGGIAEDNGAEACGVTGHLEFVDDAVHEVEHLREALAADTTRRIDDKYDVYLATATWMEAGL